MHLLVRHAATVTVFAFLPLAIAAQAHAFCRKSTESPADPSYDPSASGSCGDSAGKLPLFWGKSCIEYRVVVQDAVLNEEAARSLVKSAVQPWTEAACPSLTGGTLGPRIRLVDLDDGFQCSGAKALPDTPTANIITLTNNPPKGDEENSGSTLARTSVVYDNKSGAINSAKITAYEVGNLLATDSAKAPDRLAGRLRHEFGHFLGLAHSADRNAIMFFSEITDGPVPTDGRSLSSDDIRGICAIYNPDQPIGLGCSASPASPGPDAIPSSNGITTAIFGIATLGIISRRRRT